MNRRFSAAGLIFWTVLFCLALWSFDHAMRKDAERLCANDETAYPECGQ